MHVSLSYALLMSCLFTYKHRKVSISEVYTYSIFDCIFTHGRVHTQHQVIHCRTDCLNFTHQIVQLWNLFFSFILSFHLQCCLYSLQGQTCSFHQPQARKQQLPILITPSPRIVFCLLFIVSQSVTTLVSCNLLESWYHLVNLVSLITVKLVYVVC